MLTINFRRKKYLRSLFYLDFMYVYDSLMWNTSILKGKKKLIIQLNKENYYK